MSERSLILEIQRPDSERQWDFFITLAQRHLPVLVEVRNGRQILITPIGDTALLALPATAGETAAAEW